MFFSKSVPTLFQLFWNNFDLNMLINRYGMHPKSERPQKCFFKICSNFVPTFLEQLWPKLAYKSIWYASQVRKTPKKSFFSKSVPTLFQLFWNNFDLNLLINRYGMHPKSERSPIVFFSKSVPTLFQNNFDLNLLIKIWYLFQLCSKIFPILFQLFWNKLDLNFLINRYGMHPKSERLLKMFFSKSVPTLFQLFWNNFDLNLLINWYGMHPKSEWPPKNVFFFKICSNFVSTVLEWV